MRVRLVAIWDEIFVAQREQVLRRRIDVHGWQRPRLARELPPRLFQMVEIKVRIAERVDKDSRFESGHLRDGKRQQRIGGDVERHANKYVGRALVELAG